MKTLFHAYADTGEQLASLLEATNYPDRLVTRDGRPARILFEVQQGDEGFVQTVVQVQPDIEVTHGPLKSEDRERYRYYCNNGPLDGMWVEWIGPIDDLRLGVANGRYVHCDAGALHWIGRVE